MTTMAWAIVVVVVALAAAAGSWWQARARGRRALGERARLYEDQLERQRVLWVDRATTARRGLEAAQLAGTQAEQANARATAEREREADRRVAAAVREVTERAEDERAVLQARLARVDGQRLAVEQKLVELAASSARRLGDAIAEQRRLGEHDAELRDAAAAAREVQLAGDLTRWQARARSLAEICQIDAVAAAPIYVDRPAPGELEAIARRMRGLAFVDCVTVADPSGLPLDRGASRDADDLAALVPIVARAAGAVAACLGPVRGVIVHTDDARVIELRSLPAWVGDAWLVAQSSAQPPPPAALDAAVAYAHAMRDAPQPRGRLPAFGARGRLGPGGARRDALGDELEHATRGLGARTVALALGDQVLAGVEADGIGGAEFGRLLGALRQVYDAACARLRAFAISRVEIDVVGAVRLALAPLGTGARLDLVTLTVGRALDPLEVERVVGRLRRFLDTSGAVVASGAS